MAKIWMARRNAVAARLVVMQVLRNRNLDAAAGRHNGILICPASGGPDDGSGILPSGNCGGSVTEAFGEPFGTFQWHGKTYGYTMVPQLPCFPVEKP